MDMVMPQLASAPASPVIANAAGSMSDRLRIGVFGGGPPWPAAVARLLAGSAWCHAEFIRWPGRGAPAADGRFALDAAIVVAARRAGAATAFSDHRPAYAELLEQFRTQRIGAIWIGEPQASDPLDPTGPILMPPDVSEERLRGALAALSHARPTLLSMDRQLADLQMLGEHLRRYFTDLEHDLSLAARLQRDFLPREMPVVGPLSFATLYRPCNWVSGDMLDIFQIDANRVAFYLIDAMGHGVAAALLTMFIRNAIRPRSADRAAAAWLAPAEVLSKLNEVLAAERLPDCQFLTGWYGIIDVSKMELRYASAGHPAALHCRADGQVEELGPTGALLGVFASQTFAVRTITLGPGDRLLLFSDGLEDAFREASGPNGEHSVAGAMAALKRDPAARVIETLAHQLDHLPGAFSTRSDDVSVIAVDVQS